MNSNVSFFKDTIAYELAQAIQNSDLEAIENLIKNDSTLLEVTNPVSASNVLVLCLYIETFESFNKLLTLGASPNFVNPVTKRSVLIESIKFYDNPSPFTIDLRFTKLLLEYGADPNYVVERSFTDSQGHHQNATSPLMEASKLDLDLVKLLIKYGANPYQEIDEDSSTPFTSALRGFKNKFEISSYFIDSLDVDLHKPCKVYFRKSDGKRIVLHVQDLIVNKFTKAKLLDDKHQLEILIEGNPEIEKLNQERWALILKLKEKGVNFKDYDYRQ